MVLKFEVGVEKERMFKTIVAVEELEPIIHMIINCLKKRQGKQEASYKIIKAGCI